MLFNMSYLRNLNRMRSELIEFITDNSKGVVDLSEYNIKIGFLKRGSSSVKDLYPNAQITDDTDLMVELKALDIITLAEIADTIERRRR